MQQTTKRAQKPRSTGPVVSSSNTWPTWAVLVGYAFICSLFQIAEGFAPGAEVSEQVAVFLVGDGRTLWAYVNGPRRAVIVSWDRNGQDKDAVLLQMLMMRACETVRRCDWWDASVF